MTGNNSMHGGPAMAYLAVLMVNPALDALLALGL